MNLQCSQRGCLTRFRRDDVHMANLRIPDSFAQVWPTPLFPETHRGQEWQWSFSRIWGQGNLNNFVACSADIDPFREGFLEGLQVGARYLEAGVSGWASQEPS